MLATTHGKDYALRELAKRRKRNKGRAPFDNSSLHAGSPMYFPCDACGEPVRHPEDYLTRVRLCVECQALQAMGWLTQ